MRLLLLLVILIALAVMLVTIVRAFQDRRTERDPWKLRESSDGETLRLQLRRAGEEPLLVEAIPFDAEDFDMRLYEARARAQERLIALNSGRELAR